MTPHAAYASTNTYPASIVGCRLVRNPGGGSFTCDLKDSTPDKYFDPWSEENRECTSYAAWMLHSVNGFEMPFHDNANNWGADARNAHFTINMTPAVGSIYWKQQGTGHVAWVEAISPDKSSVTIEDYNHDYKHNWAEYPVSTTSASGYIHFQDISSSWPGVGNATFLGSDHLNVGQTMQGNQYIVSGNVQYALIMQSDGNLAEYSGGSAIWANNKSGNPGAYLGLQSDGNIVEYTSSGKSIWATNTNGQSLAYLVIQSDGNLVAYNTKGSPIWANNTGGHPTGIYFGSDRLYNGNMLSSSYYIRSSDLRYALLMQADGNLILFGPGYHVLWASGTNGNPGAYLGLQNDGNIVIYSSSGKAIWATNTNGQSLSYLIMQSDGNLVAYSPSGSAIWATNTNGQI